MDMTNTLFKEPSEVYEIVINYIHLIYDIFEGSLWDGNDTMTELLL